MDEESQNRDDRIAGMDEGTEITKAELHVTKYVATCSGKRRFPVDASPERAESRIDLHGQLVDSAISHISSDLPAEVTRVSQLQRHHGSLIASLQTELQQVEEEKRKVTTRTGELQEEVDRVRRQTYLLEDECSKKHNCCVQLKNEILSLVKEGEAKRRLLATRSLEMSTLKQQMAQYRQTLEDYSTSMATTDTCSTVHIDSTQQEDRKATLRQKKQFLAEKPEEVKRICSGAAERELKEDIAQLQSQSDLVQEEVKQLRQKVEAIRAKQVQVKQATAVLRKRNAAQLIRLKRQVKEQHLRHRQWTEQKRLLQQNITTFNQKLQST